MGTWATLAQRFGAFLVLSAFEQPCAGNSSALELHLHTGIKQDAEKCVSQQSWLDPNL